MQTELSSEAGRAAGQPTVRSWPVVILIMAAVGMLYVPVLAHHSYAAFYLEADTIDIEGIIVEFQYKNPHSWIHVEGQDGALGTPKLYAAEWAGTSRLESDGITKSTLRVGDRVRIWASPNRNPSDNRVRLKRIERRADGWKWGRNLEVRNEK